VVDTSIKICDYYRTMTAVCGRMAADIHMITVLDVSSQLSEDPFSLVYDLCCEAKAKLVPQYQLLPKQEIVVGLRDDVFNILLMLPTQNVLGKITVFKDRTFSFLNFRFYPISQWTELQTGRRARATASS
jgi:hypothetical protein